MSQRSKVTIQEFNSEYPESMTLMPSSEEQLPPVVIHCVIHVSSTSEHVQLHPEAAIILHYIPTLRCHGNVT